MTTTHNPWPLELRYKSETATLVIHFDNGDVYDLPAELLRVESPSAEVQGHGPGQKKLISGKSDIGIMSMEAVGNYAVRINFSDEHNTGIFTWTYLEKLGQQKDKIWQDYLDALQAAGLSR